MGQKQSAQEDEVHGLPDLPKEPFYSTKRFTTDELLHLLNQASHVTFSHPDEFRAVGSSQAETDTYLKTALVNLQQEGDVYYEVSFEDKEEFANVRISKSIPPESIPYATSTLVKQAFMHWDILDQPNRYLRGVHDDLVYRFNGAFLDLLDELNKQTLNETQKVLKIKEMLNQKAAFLKPGLVYAAQMLFIEFISSLTNSKYSAEAKAVHQFVRICKKAMKVIEDPYEREKAAVLVIPVLYEGLHLHRAFTASSSERIKLFNTFLAVVFNLTMAHPLFDEDYNQETYELYAKLNSKCTELNIGIEVNPALAQRELSNYFLDELNKEYQDIVTKYLHKDSREAKKAVYEFFVNKIRKAAAFEPLQARAQNMHNVLYILKLVYQEDKAKNEQCYASVIRQILQLPRVDEIRDAWFDKLAVYCILQREKGFNREFMQEDYNVSSQDQQEYCVGLTQEYQLKFKENNELKHTLQQKDLVIESQQEQIASLNMRLIAIQEQLSALTLKTKNEQAMSSIPEPASPSLTRLHFPHFHASKSGEDSPPRARKHSNPQKLSVEKSPPKERKHMIDEEAPLLMESNEPSVSPPKERKLLHTLSAPKLRQGRKKESLT